MNTGIAFVIIFWFITPILYCMYCNLVFRDLC